LSLALLACGASNITSTASPAAPAPATPPTARSVLTGAGVGERESASMKVAAASDLRAAMTAHQAEIEGACNTKITWVFGSSGQLTTQIVAGADFGLLLSADIRYPEDMDRRGLLVPNGIASYGVGRVVIATRPGLEPVASLRDLARADIRKVAIANPGHAPYGRAAKQALEAAGIYDAINDRLVLGENIRQTTDYVEQGNADAGIAALALVVNGSPATWTLIDSELHRPLEQAGGVVKGTGAELTGRCILQFLLDPAGQAILRRYGFEEVPAR
jgi:molybdate transport system substrate-binding protein